jgi:hypothetical protein
MRSKVVKVKDDEPLVSVRDRIYRETAVELAYTLDSLVENTLGGGDEAQLREFLWDNKMGILRCLQAFVRQSRD